MKVDAVKEEKAVISEGKEDIEELKERKHQTKKSERIINFWYLFFCSGASTK